MIRTESFSSIGCYAQCPLKYKKRYIDKLQVKIAKPEAERGKKIHKLIELSKEVDENHEFFEALEYAKKILKKAKRTNGTIQDLSSFSTFDLKIKDNRALIEKKELGFGLTVSCEPCEFDSPNALFRGFVDLVQLEISKKEIIKKINKEDKEQDLFLDLNKAVVSCSLRDWKTGKYRSGRKQLNSYAIYFFAKYPRIQEIDCQNIFVSEKRNSPLWFCKRKKAQEVWEKIKEEIQIIRSSKSFPAKKSPLCGWCDYQEGCKGFLALRAGESILTK